MKYGSIISKLRRQKNLSQVELAHKANVSLPTIQNIEANKANPSIQTLELIFSVLGLALLLQSKAPNFEKLTPLGLPFLSKGLTQYVFLPSKEHLIETLNGEAHGFKFVKDLRLKDALVGFLRAIQDHYPTIWQRLDQEIHDWLTSQDYLGRHTKLRRIALSKFKEYL